MTSHSDELEGAASLLASISPAPWALLTDDELCERLAEIEAVGRLVDALRVSGAGELDHRSRRSLGTEGLAYRNGARRPEYLLEKVTRVSQREAAHRIRVGRELRGREALDGRPLPPPFERVTDAVDAGEIGIDAALAITTNLREAAERATLEQIDAGELELVARAQNESADLVAIAAVAWRTALDPDGTQPRVDMVRAKRRFTIGRETVDGLTPFSGMAEPIFAATLRFAIGERTAPSRTPRFLDEADACDDAVVLDGRTNEQRSYDVLEGLLTAGIRADSAGRTPLHSVATVNVVVRASDLAAETGPAWLDDVREPISAALAAELGCSGGITLIGVDHAGQPLWVGRRERYFTAAQRKALAVRDGGCVFPDCGAPPSWCHAHHIVEWAEGGQTDIDNGVLLCAFHHHLVHRGEFRLRGGPKGPELLAPSRLDRDRIWRPVGRARWKQAA